jgi:plasmid stabilization system protein ParE
MSVIAEQGVELFGFNLAELYQQALLDQFELLAEHPRLGRPVGSAQYPEALKFGVGVHIIIYSALDDGILINRIFDARSNYSRHL